MHVPVFSCAGEEEEGKDGEDKRGRRDEFVPMGEGCCGTEGRGDTLRI